MMTKPRFLAAILVLFSTVAATRADSPADPKNPPQGKFSDGWMAILLDGQKMGYAHSEQSRQAQEIHSAQTVYMSIRRAGAVLEVKMDTSSVESVAGEPLGFASEILLGNQPIRTRGSIAGGVITVTKEQYDTEFVNKIDYPVGALMGWGMYLEMLKHELKPGTKITLLAFEPSQALNVGLQTTIEVLGREELDLLGKRVSGIKVKTTTTIYGVDIESIGWVDEQWEPLKQEISMMGLKFEMITCDKAYALKDIGSAEVFINTLIPLGRSIDRRRARSVTYRITSTGDTALPDIPNTEMQQVIEKSANHITLKVTRGNYAELASAAPRIPPAALSKYVKASVFISSDDAEVAQMAAEAAETETNPYKLAEKLCHKVSKTIKYKNLGTAFATAAEVCRSKEGDCTEHGVLLAALGRSRGIPTRLVTGLIYVARFGDQRDVLGFHMWTQYWINGKWVDLDSAWNQVEVDATHIALGTHSTEHGTMGSMVSSVMMRINDFKISVVDVELEE